MNQESREKLLYQWACDQLPPDRQPEADSLLPVSGDASFRRYFRLPTSAGPVIAVDAPVATENNPAFVAILKRFARAGIQVPELLAADLETGFLLLSDLGDTLYLQVLDDASANRLYGAAMAALVPLGQCIDVPGWPLPVFDRSHALAEMQLFVDWLLQRHLALELSSSQSDLISRLFSRLADNVQAQPQVCIHRDYHSRNLMVVEQNGPGVIDFQDAMLGPLTYDIVSLLKDCYIQWPRERVLQWLALYRERVQDAGLLPASVDGETFLRWFDLMGVQRHLKAAGIFARLKHRDDKPGYLKDIPRTLGYITAISDDYPELKVFGDFLRQEVLPRLAETSMAGADS